jgi:hypothetical protein
MLWVCCGCLHPSRSCIGGSLVATLGGFFNKLCTSRWKVGSGRGGFGLATMDVSANKRSDRTEAADGRHLTTTGSGSSRARYACWKATLTSGSDDGGSERTFDKNEQWKKRVSECRVYMMGRD